MDHSQHNRNVNFIWPIFANEMAHTYSHLYALPTTGLRFFTVYGP